MKSQLNIKTLVEKSLDYEPDLITLLNPHLEP